MRLVRESIRALPLFGDVFASVHTAANQAEQEGQAELVTMLLLACGELLLPLQRARVDERAGENAFVGPLGDELSSLRAQVAALRDSADEAFAEESRVCAR